MSVGHWLIAGLTVGLFLTNGGVHAQTTDDALPRKNQIIHQPQVLIPPSPEAASLGKYGDLQAGHYTGSVPISIDLGSLEGRELNIPFGLNYNYQGLQVREIASWAGLGWTFEAGGVITRSVLGRPDEGYASSGYESYFEAWPRIKKHRAGYNSAAGYDRLAAEDMLRFELENRSGSFETEPDIIYYNFLGRSGRIIIDPESGQAYTAPWSGLKITPAYGPSASSSGNWCITDEQGNQYFFQAREETRAPGAAETGSMNYTSAWYLTRIESANGLDVFTFDYTTRTVTNLGTQSTQEAVQYILTPSDDCGRAPKVLDGIATDVEVDQLFLRKITSNRGDYVEIDAQASRSDHAEGMQLRGLRYYNQQGELTREYTLEHGYFGERNTELIINPVTGQEEELVLEGNENLLRLRLDAVQEIGHLGPEPIAKPPSRFYYLEDQEFPRRTSTAIDHWGFYNGASDYQSLIPAVNNYNGTIGLNLPGGDRMPDPDHARLGTLQKMQYPTGGYTVIDYEPHLLSKERAHDLYGFTQEWRQANFTLGAAGQAGLSSEEYCFKDCDDAINYYPTVKVGTYTFDRNKKVIVTITEKDETGTADVGYFTFASIYPGGGIVPSNPLSTVPEDNLFHRRSTGVGNSVIDRFVLTGMTGDAYTIMVACNKPGASIEVNIAWSELVEVDPFADISGPNVPVGGMRVRAMTDHDGKEGSQPVTKQYDYIPATEVADQGVYPAAAATQDRELLASSGLLFTTPAYSKQYRYTFPEDFVSYANSSAGFIIREEYSCEYLMRQANTVHELGRASGSHIGYDAVYEYVLDEAGERSNGYTLYEYNNNRLNQSRPEFGATNPNYAARNGKLLRSAVYNDQGQILTETLQDYLFSESLAGAEYSQVGVVTQVKQPDFYWYCIHHQEGADGETEVYTMWEHPNVTRDLPYLQELNDGACNQYHAITDDMESYFYSFNTGWDVLSQTRERRYAPGNTEVYMETVTNYHYDNPEHAQVSRVEVIDPLNQLTTTQYHYAADLDTSYAPFIADMQTKHLQSEPVIQTIYQGEPASGLLLDQAVYSFAKQSSGAQTRVQPAGTYVLQNTKPLAFAERPNMETFSPVAYFEELDINYNAAGNPYYQRDAENQSQTWIWSDDGTDVLVELRNQSLNNIAWTDFEPDYTQSAWSYASAQLTEALADAETTPHIGKEELSWAATGFYVYDLSGAVPLSYTLGTELDFVLSFWYKGSDTPQVNFPEAAQISQVIAGRDDWQLYTYRFAGAENQTLSINGTGYLDQVRLHPFMARLSSFAYRDGLGLISRSDANNLTTRYYYDGLGRLNYVKDFEGHVTVTYDYGYAQETDDSPFDLNGFTYSPAYPFTGQEIIFNAGPVLNARPAYRDGASYYWAMGEGTSLPATSNLTSRHSYTTASTYAVTLDVDPPVSHPYQLQVQGDVQVYPPVAVSLETQELTLSDLNGASQHTGQALAKASGGTGDYTYNWRIRPLNGAAPAWQPISGHDLISFLPDYCHYELEVSATDLRNQANQATATATHTFNLLAEASLQVLAHDASSYTATVTIGCDVESVTWYQREPGSTDWGSPVGTGLQVTGTANCAAVEIKAVVTDGTGGLTELTETLTADFSPSLEWLVRPTSAAVNQSLSFTVSGLAACGSLSYNWEYREPALSSDWSPMGTGSSISLVAGCEDLELRVTATTSGGQQLSLNSGIIPISSNPTLEISVSGAQAAVHSSTLQLTAVTGSSILCPSRNEEIKWFRFREGCPDGGYCYIGEGLTLDYLIPCEEEEIAIVARIESEFGAVNSLPHIITVTGPASLQANWESYPATVAAGQAYTHRALVAEGCPAYQYRYERYDYDPGNQIWTVQQQGAADSYTHAADYDYKLRVYIEDQSASIANEWLYEVADIQVALQQVAISYQSGALTFAVPESKGGRGARSYSWAYDLLNDPGEHWVATGANSVQIMHPATGGEPFRLRVTISDGSVSPQTVTAYMEVTNPVNIGGN